MNLMSRKLTILLISLMFFLYMVLIFIIALRRGYVLVGRGYVNTYYRDKQPREFWRSIILGLVIGILVLCGGLYIVFHLS
jgi:hypothetical protein